MLSKLNTVLFRQASTGGAERAGVRVLIGGRPCHPRGFRKAPVKLK